MNKEDRERALKAYKEGKIAQKNYEASKPIKHTSEIDKSFNTIEKCLYIIGGLIIVKVLLQVLVFIYSVYYEK